MTRGSGAGAPGLSLILAGMRLHGPFHNSSSVRVKLKKINVLEEWIRCMNVFDLSLIVMSIFQRLMNMYLCQFV